MAFNKLTAWAHVVVQISNRNTFSVRTLSTYLFLIKLFLPLSIAPSRDIQTVAV